MENCVFSLKTGWNFKPWCVGMSIFPNSCSMILNHAYYPLEFLFGCLFFNSPTHLIMTFVIFEQSLREISRGTCSDVHTWTKFEGEFWFCFATPDFYFIWTCNRSLVFACNSILIGIVCSKQRLLVVELHSISCEEAPQKDRYCWSDELYPGEFDDLGICSLHSKEIGELIPPKIIGFESHSLVIRSNQQPDHEILQIWNIPPLYNAYN